MGISIPDASGRQKINAFGQINVAFNESYDRLLFIIQQQYLSLNIFLKIVPFYVKCMNVMIFITRKKQPTQVSIIFKYLFILFIQVVMKRLAFQSSRVRTLEKYLPKLCCRLYRKTNKKKHEAFSLDLEYQQIFIYQISSLCFCQQI